MRERNSGDSLPTVTFNNQLNQILLTCTVQLLKHQVEPSVIFQEIRADVQLATKEYGEI